MLLSEDGQQLLQKFLVRTLKPMYVPSKSLLSSLVIEVGADGLCVFVMIAPFSSDADPGVLAKYVLALVKNNKTKEELRSTCDSQLQDFLGEGVWCKDQEA